REISGDLVATLAQPWKEPINVVQAGVDCGPTLQMPSSNQVLLDCQILEDAPSFEYLGDTASHDLVRRQAVEPCTVELDRASRHLAALGVQDSRDCLKRRRLPSSIGAEQCRDRPLFGAQRDALEHEDNIVIDDLYVIDCEHYADSAVC